MDKGKGNTLPYGIEGFAGAFEGYRSLQTPCLPPSTVKYNIGK